MKRRMEANGSVMVYLPEHPLARTHGQSKGYVSEHRYVAWENGLLTDPADQVAHKNKIRDDNRIENLTIRDASSGKAICKSCDRLTTAQSGVCQNCSRSARAQENELKRQSVDMELRSVDAELQASIKSVAFGRVHVYRMPGLTKGISDIVIDRSITSRVEELSLLKDTVKDAHPQLLAVLDRRIEVLQATLSAS